MSNDGFFDKVKDFIKGHPERADHEADTAQETLDDESTGGSFSGQLGVPDDNGGTQPPETTPEPPTVPDPTQPSTTQPQAREVSPRGSRPPRP